MKYQLAITSLVSFAVSVYAAPVESDMTINTPAALFQCEPVEITWAGGQAPYTLSAIPTDGGNERPYGIFPNLSGTAFTWDVDVPAGTGVSFALEDSTNALAFTIPVTVGDSDNTSCLN